MRRIVVVIVAVLMVFGLVGCGGGGDEAAAPEGEVAVQTQGAATVPAPTGATLTASEASSNTLSPQEAQKFEAFPTDEEALPDVIAQRLESERPMLVLFYDATQKTTDDQRVAVDSVMAEYRGLIDLVSFDVSKYVTTDASGVVTPKDAITDDPTARAVATLMGGDHLNVKFTPYIVFVDKQGYITYRVRGYVDSAFIEREVLRATE